MPSPSGCLQGNAALGRDTRGLALALLGGRPGRPAEQGRRRAGAVDAPVVAVVAEALWSH